MSKALSYFSHLPKKALSLALALTSVFVMTATVLAGYGPDRPTIAWQGPGTSGFDYVTFNSFTGVSNGIGDERDFVRGKIVGQGATTVDQIENVKDGDVLYITMYVHNNAKTSLGVMGEAENLRARAEIPAGSGTSIDIKGYISATNAQPVTVYDTVTIKGSNAFMLEYVPGSATMVTNVLNYAAVNDSLIVNGADIGYDALDGTMPGCFEYSGWVNFRVEVNEVERPDIEIVKDVQDYEDGANSPWLNQVNVSAGSTIRYRINVSNTGSVDLANVLVKDTLPGHLNDVTVTKASGPNYTGNLFAEGITIASFTKDSTLSLIVEATLDSVAELPCGEISLLNVASASSTSTGEVKDDAKVKTTRTCVDECIPGSKYCPDELPNTGPGEFMTSLFGLSALGAATRSWIRSKKELLPKA